MVVVKNVFPEKGSLAMKESPKEHIKRNSLAKCFPLYDFVHCLKLRNSASPPTHRWSTNYTCPRRLPAFCKLSLVLFAPAIDGGCLRVSAIADRFYIR